MVMGVDDAEADQRNQKYGRIAPKRGPRGDSILALNLARAQRQRPKAPNEHRKHKTLSPQNKRFIYCYRTRSNIN